MTERVKLAIIGSGRAGMIHARNFTFSIDSACVISVSDPSSENRNAAQAELGCDNAYEDYRDALKDPDVDAVLIASPTVYHREIAIAAAQAGKHIFCEKPMAMNVEECDKIIEAVEKAGVKFQIGFMRRFDSGFVDAYNRIKSGEVGNVVQVKSLTHGPSTPKPWMYDIAQSNGPLAEVNSHDIDTLRWFTGSEISEVYAVAGNYRCPEAQKEYPDFYDTVTMLASFENGMQGVVCGAQGVKYGYDSRCEVLGEHGLISVGRLEEPAVKTLNEKGMHSPVVQSWRNLFIDAYRAEDTHFIDCIQNDTDPSVTGIDGRMAVAVVNAGNRSIVEKKPIRL